MDRCIDLYRVPRSSPYAVTGRATAGESRTLLSSGFAASCAPATPRSPVQGARRPSDRCARFFVRRALRATTRRMCCRSVAQGGGARILPRRSLSFCLLARRVPQTPCELASSALRARLCGWCTGSRFPSGRTHCRLGCGDGRGDDQAYDSSCSVFEAWLSRSIPHVRRHASGRIAAMLWAIGIRGEEASLVRPRTWSFRALSAPFATKRS